MIATWLVALYKGSPLMIVVWVHKKRRAPEGAPSYQASP